MLAMRTGTEASMPQTTNPNPEIKGNSTKAASHYEQCREERIKENLQRMQNLGIMNLARKLQSETRPGRRQFGNSDPASKSTPPVAPSRRSSRLENTTPVIYNEVVSEKGKKVKRERLMICEGPRLEVYTEEHEKLLGNTERSWTLFVDGYDKDGKRVYDPFKGKTCHQCRQKTLGHRTDCSECNLVRGQFCGDCLFMRYGEHVLEALENPDWVCPPCRGICNCSICRNHRGWVPTGPIYRRVAKLGYKSVAHYLMQTKRAQTDDVTPNQASAKRSLSFQEANQHSNVADDDDLPNEVPKLQNMVSQDDDSLKKEEDANTNEDPNSAKRSLSFVLPSLDDQTPSVDVQDLEPPKQDKEDHSCSGVGDNNLPTAQERTGQVLNLDTKEESYFLPGGNQTPLAVDVKVLSDETETISNSVNTRETRSKSKASLEPNPDSIGRLVNTPETRRKRKTAQEPNPDSIGARLRQRRRSQSGL